MLITSDNNKEIRYKEKRTSFGKFKQKKKRKAASF